MSDISSNNKRIAKNTFLLYVRMLFLMIISLYTSRVILNVLGVTDFGIYNVVGGLIAMFSIISNSLSGAISRFLTFELGQNNKEKLKIIFSTAMNIQVLMGLIIFLLIETVGVWFLNCKMNIPVGRMHAANWVLQFSAFSFFINLISVPYNASIISHEKMSVFAYISMIEGISKLLIAYMIIISPIDKLVFYAMLIFFVSFFLRIIYRIYCKKHFEECTYSFFFERKLLKEMFNFSSWNFIGTSAGVLRNEGTNVLLNVFFGASVNAASGIANQINCAISGFSGNFITAAAPQIIKYYSRRKILEAYKLTLNVSRLSYFLLLFLVLPMIFELRYIVSIWLVKIPQETIEFATLVLILTLIESISLPFIILQQATGNIKNYQLVVGTLHLLNLPISYILLYCGAKASIVYIVAIILAGVCLFARIFMLNVNIHISIIIFLEKVLLKIVFVTGILLIMDYIYILNTNLHPVFNIIVFSIFSFLIIVSFGLKKEEKSIIISKLRRIL